MTNFPNKEAPVEYVFLRDKLWESLGWPCDRKPLLIGIDGKDGAGKTSLANWLAWQLGMEAIHLDQFTEFSENGIREWRLQELSKVINSRLQRCSPKPVIVEGILLLEALSALSLEPNYLIYVIRNEEMGYGGSTKWNGNINRYLNEYQPKEKAHYSFLSKFP